MSNRNITYHEFETSPCLKDYIKCYWHFRIAPEGEKLIDILPDGYFDFLAVIKNGQLINTRLTGIWSKAVTIRYTENTEVFGIRFKPMAAGTLFHSVIKDALDGFHTAALTDLGIHEQIFLDSYFTQPSILSNYLDVHFSKLVSCAPVDRRIKHCFDLIETNAGNISIGKLSHSIGLSSRQLQRIANNILGLGIKEYSKIVRFNQSMHHSNICENDYRHYYDQSHYIREVKHFTGRTPQKLNLNNNDRFIQYFDFGPQ